MTYLRLKQFDPSLFMGSNQQANSINQSVMIPIVAATAAPAS